MTLCSEMLSAVFERFLQARSVDSSRYTFVRKNIAKKQEHAQDTALSRLPKSVHTPASGRLADMSID